MARYRGLPTLTINLSQIDTNLYKWKYKYLTSVPVSGQEGYRLLSADIDSNGKVEVYGPYLDRSTPYGQPRIYEYDHAARYWQLRYVYRAEIGSMTNIADMDLNGRKEVYTVYGDTVFAFESPAPRALPTQLKFTFRQWYHNGIGIPSEIADVNNDGRGEFVARGSDSVGENRTHKVFIAKYDSLTNTLERIWGQQFPPWCGQMDCTDNLSIGDSDGDGEKEIVTSSFSGNVYLIEHTSNGSFSVVWTDSVSVAGRVATGDVDGNGMEEFFVGGNQPEADGVHMRIYAYERTGDNSFQPYFAFDIFPVAYFSADLYDAVDIDGDGQRELLIFNKAGNLIIKGSGMHSYELFYFRRVANTDGLSSGDITGDGVRELFMSRSVTGGLDDPYFWTDIFQIDSTLTSAVSQSDTSERLNFEIQQNYPNPFNPQTTLSYTIAQSSRVKIVVFSIEGREVIELVNAHQEAGRHTALWNGQSQGGEKVASGIYFYRLTVGEFSQTRKLVLLR